MKTIKISSADMNALPREAATLIEDQIDDDTTDAVRADVVAELVGLASGGNLYATRTRR